MLDTTGDATLAPVMEPLRRTAPWARFIAILNFVFVAVILLGAVGIAFLPIPGMPERGVARFFGLIYVPIGLLYLLPAILSMRYATGITQFLQTQSPDQLAVALNAQRRVWKFWGILFAIGLAFSFLSLILMVFVFGTMGGMPSGMP